jgi:VWFA-related protein
VSTRLLVTTLGLAATLVATATGQQPTFRSGVDVIQVDVIVTDKQGNPVTDLTADDFEILEEGTPQTIATMSLVDIPIERRARDASTGGTPEPDVLSNAADGDRRLYTIVLGTYSPTDGMKARHFLRRFLDERFEDGDIGAVLYMGQAPVRSAQPFTGNRRLLLNAVDNVALGGDTGVRPLMTFGRILEAVARVDARRKTVVLVTSTFQDTFDIIDNVGGVKSIEQEALNEAIGIATRGNVAIYTVDPAGLTAGFEGMSDGLTAESAPTPAAAAEASLSTLGRRQNLRAIAWLTGGFGLTNSNNFEDAFERIVRETSTYYLLGYYPTNQRQDGRFRRLTVRVKRPGLEVRSRIGYVAEGPQRTRPAQLVRARSVGAELRRVINSPITANGLPLRVTAVPFRGTKDQAVVGLAVHVDATRIGLTEDNDRFVGELEVGHLATNEQNRVVPGEFHVVKIDLTRASHQRALRRGVLVLTEARLRPGRYQLRIAATNRVDSSGSVVYDLDVPDFTREPLTMSGVVLTSDGADEAPMIRNKAAFDGMPATPTTLREFTTANTITAFVELYDNDRRSSHTLAATVRLQTADGRAVRTLATEVASADRGDDAHRVSAELPLAGLAAGEYVVAVEARSSAGAETVVRRAVPIRIQ